MGDTRLRFLEALARRTERASGELRTILDERLAQAVADHQARAGRSSALRSDTASAAGPDPSPGALAELNHYLRSAARAAGDTSTAAVPELRSARRFAESWPRIRAEQRIGQALAQAPANAGPLNPHRLMLRSLEQLRDLSPDYLWRFLAHAETLLWIERAGNPPGTAPTRAKVRTRSRRA